VDGEKTASEHDPLPEAPTTTSFLRFVDIVDEVTNCDFVLVCTFFKLLFAWSSIFLLLLLLTILTADDLVDGHSTTFNTLPIAIVLPSSRIVNLPICGNSLNDSIQIIPPVHSSLIMAT